MMDKKIFTYWVNPPGRSIPAYLQLCLQTWYEHIPELDLIVINHDNIFDWVDENFDIDRFIRLSLPMQKDIVEMLVLQKHGGIFMDVDTIIIKDIFSEFEKMDSKKLIAFGVPETKSMHLAIFVCLSPQNKFISSAAKMAIEKLNDIPLIGALNINWDHFGNSIFDTLLNDNDYSDCVDVLDRTETGNIIESHYFTNLTTGEQYFNFFFSQNNIDIQDVIPKIKFGAISLHNSWTPDIYKAYSLDEVIESNTMMSAIIRYALTDFLNE
ncbi:MAG: hypothetical protein FWG88_09700 [Oscillospiraceae bacterium]|nr:hypothetical protein [Oscillospiraceae bacterium]